MPNPHRVTRIVLAALALSLVCCGAAHSQTLLLKDGRKLEGKYAEIGSIAENPLSPKAQAGEVPVTPLLVVDDGLRRTYIHSSQWSNMLETSVGQRSPNQHLAASRRDRRLASAASAGRSTITPFDKCGRRIYTMQTAGGPLAVVQGITQITPLYTKIEGLSRRSEAGRVGHANRHEQHSARNAQQASSPPP